MRYSLANPTNRLLAFLASVADVKVALKLTGTSHAVHPSRLTVKTLVGWRAGDAISGAVSRSTANGWINCAVCMSVN